MGIKLIIILAILLKVLFTLHLLLKGYIAVTKPKFLRMPRDVLEPDLFNPHVRWKSILDHDHLQCAMIIFCCLGVDGYHDELQDGFIQMLQLETIHEDEAALGVFKKAYTEGLKYSRPQMCKRTYPLCPFSGDTLFKLITFLQDNPAFVDRLY